MEGNRLRARFARLCRRCGRRADRSGLWDAMRDAPNHCHAEHQHADYSYTAKPPRLVHFFQRPALPLQRRMIASSQNEMLITVDEALNEWLRRVAEPPALWRHCLAECQAAGTSACPDPELSVAGFLV